jgi:hypothetical protein
VIRRLKQIAAEQMLDIHASKAVVETRVVCRSARRDAVGWLLVGTDG